MKLNKIVSRKENFAEWYTSIVNNAKLALYGNIKGTIIFQPNGWAIWNSIIEELNKEFKKIGIQNVQLPTFIPYSQFMKEKEHVEGFAPEIFLVTKKSNEILDEPYVVRPTSEVLFCNYFKEIVKSYNDLPILYNQWCNAFRVEKTTRPFLRNSEFYWQEMHSIHENEQEAINTAKKLIDIYEYLATKLLCIPVLKGEKTEGEKFAGAINTYTIEALMQDGQALQCATSHYLGQNFSKTYDIKFQNKSNAFENVYQTSAGLSTRLIGGLIMSHSDDNGLVLPPLIAPKQIALLPLFFENNKEVKNITEKIANDLNKYRVYVDWSLKSMGYKLSEQEINGTPFSIIVGPNDLKNGLVEIYRRDLLKKEKVKLESVNKWINEKILEFSKNIFNKANERLQKSIVQVNSIDEMKKCVNQGKIALAYWAGSADDEKKIKEMTGASPRCIKEQNSSGVCILTNKKSKQLVYFARAY